jgi:hypothetical protein
MVWSYGGIVVTWTHFIFYLFFSTRLLIPSASHKLPCESNVTPVGKAIGVIVGDVIGGFPRGVVGALVGGVVGVYL